MFSMIRRPRAWRATLLLLMVSGASALAAGGAVAVPSAGGVAAPSATSQTRASSCHAFEFLPVDSATDSDYANAKRIRAGAGGSGFFICDPRLPDRAVVTKVQFSIWDGSGSSEVKFCGLYRSGLGASTFDTIEELASMPGTGIAQAPGFARLTDTTILNATVNDRSFAYELQCNLPQAGQSLGLFGADVFFTISAVNG
jgi:hypothetical protein